MKNNAYILLIILFLFFVIVIASCSSKYIALNKESFQTLDVNDVLEVNLVSAYQGDDPKTWESGHGYLFPIKDSEKIKRILHCIKTAKPIEYSASFEKLLFKTEKKIYYLGTQGDTKSFYGDWWDSPELLNYLEAWGLKILKGKKISQRIK